MLCTFLYCDEINPSLAILSKGESDLLGQLVTAGAPTGSFVSAIDELRDATLLLQPMGRK